MKMGTKTYAKIFVVIFFLSLLLSGCMNVAIYSDMDTSANFNSYKTFAWIPHKKNHKLKNNRFDNDIVDNRIVQSINNELVMRDLVLNTENPDILIDYYIMTENKVSVQEEPVYRNNFMYGYYRRGWRNTYRWSYGPNYWNYNMGYRTVKIPYVEGTLTVDIHDKSIERIVWKGWAIGALDNPETFAKELSKDIHSMFKKFPLTITSKPK